METVTFPEPRVIAFIEERVVPLRVPHDAKPLSDDFNIKWTPSLITLDEDGTEHHRTVGFLSPEELIPSLLLGIGKIHFEKDEPDKALVQFEKIIADYPRSDSAPEAIYLKGVSLYKIEKKPSRLKDAYEELATEYPDNEWTKRAFPYRLL